APEAPPQAPTPAPPRTLAAPAPPRRTPGSRTHGGSPTDAHTPSSDAPHTRPSTPDLRSRAAQRRTPPRREEPPSGPRPGKCQASAPSPTGQRTPAGSHPDACPSAAATPPRPAGRTAPDHKQTGPRQTPHTARPARQTGTRPAPPTSLRIEPAPRMPVNSVLALISVPFFPRPVVTAQRTWGAWRTARYR